MVMFSALVGGVALIFATSQSNSLKQISLIGASAIIGGFGILTYFWILQSEVERIDESFFLFWLHKYFRDKNADLFENYNFHRMVYHYNALDRKVASDISLANYATFSILITFSSLAVSLFAYSIIDMVLGTTLAENVLLIAFILGVICLSTMIVTLIMAIKRLELGRSEGKKMLTNFQQERQTKGNTHYVSHEAFSQAAEQAVAADAASRRARSP
jgi:hypothetical protein